MSEHSSNTGGICVLAVPVVIGIALAALKLAGQISWSWWWVTAPFWEPAAIAVVVGLYMLFSVPAKRRASGFSRTSLGLPNA